VGPWSTFGPEGERLNLSVFTPVEQQIDWLRRMKSKYLMTLAMNLFEIAEAAGADGKDLGIEAAVASGSALLPQTRKVVAQNLGARVVETYGSQEVGLIAIECPTSGLLHVCADHLVVEVLDERGEPVGPGKTGRIVLTSLYNYVTPLLRYELGDLVETADRPCACGRTLPSLKRVIGRIRKALVFPDGTHVRPHAIILAAGDEELLPAKQFQVVQTASAKFTIRYVPLDATRYAAAEAIRARFKEMVHPEVEVTLERVSEIARAASGKYEDFIYLNEAGGIS
jgi:phenylacetate-CoA ligase